MASSHTSDTRLSLLVVTSHAVDAELVRDTLAHVYPGAKVAAASAAAAEDADADLILIDTRGLSDAGIDHLLELHSSRPAILIVQDHTEMRRFARHLTGRRAAVARAELGGMGLVAAIHHLLERQRLQEQLRRAAHQIKEQAIRDELTRFINHRHFAEVLDNEVKKANRYKRPLGLVIVSIKNFTALNETLGHAEGDRILIRAAEIIRANVREVDIPARYGDNEFALILPESDEAAAGIVVARIRDALAAIALPGEGLAPRLALSSGIAALSASVRTREELLRTALGALLEAKRNGAGAICTSREVEARRREVRPNRQLMEQLGERLASIAANAQQAYFRELVKAIGDIPAMKKLLLPHSERVAFFAQRLAEHSGFAVDAARTLYRAGLLHDTGKLPIDLAILTKPARLSEPEETLVRQHPALAVQLLGRTPLIAAEIEAVLHHHERFDGHGYPDGLSGCEIPLTARILAIAEAWDTMISPQPYRPEPLSLDAALAELEQGAGSQFDPELVGRFTSLIAR